MRLNVILAAKLNDANLVNHVGGGIWKLVKGSLITVRGKKESSLYFMHGKLHKERLMLYTTTHIWSSDTKDTDT